MAAVLVEFPAVKPNDATLVPEISIPRASSDRTFRVKMPFASDATTPVDAVSALIAVAIAVACAVAVALLATAPMLTPLMTKEPAAIAVVAALVTRELVVVVEVKPEFVPPVAVALTVMFRPSAAVNVTAPLDWLATAVTPVCEDFALIAAAT